MRTAIDETSDMYYAGTENGGLYAGPSGERWALVFDKVHARVTDIEVGENIYVAFNVQTGKGRVYQLNRTWPVPATLDITANLPTNILVRTIAVDLNAPTTIYAGTNRGVYRGRSLDGGANWSWSSYNEGMPVAADVVDLEVHPVSHVMRAATLGRGAYEVRTAP